MGLCNGFELFQKKIVEAFSFIFHCRVLVEGERVIKENEEAKMIKKQAIKVSDRCFQLRNIHGQSEATIKLIANNSSE
jgi:hypothetical protein